MKVTPTALPDVLLIEPRVFGDERGFFFESWNRRDFGEGGLEAEFVQDNHSRSEHNVLRGLHYQIEHAQGKLVRVVAGEVFDVAVDIRRSSPSFGRAVGLRLSETNKSMLWIPPGFAHGFLVLSDRADFLYKTTDYWYPEHERTLLWNDPALGIAWPAERAPILTPRDADGAAERRRAPPQVDRDVPHLAAHAADQLALRVLDLVVEAAQHAAAGARMIVLHERGVDSGGGERARVPGLEKEAAVVAADDGLDQPHVGNRGRRDLHHGLPHRTSGSRRSASRYWP